MSVRGGVKMEEIAVGSISRPSRQLAGVLSDENRALLRLMHERQPRTVLELAELSGRAASNLLRTLRTMEGYGLVRMNRNTGSRSVRPEALATQFLVVLD